VETRWTMPPLLRNGR